MKFATVGNRGKDSKKIRNSPSHNGEKDKTIENAKHLKLGQSIKERIRRQYCWQERLTAAF